MLIYISLLVSAILVGIDQLIKFWAAAALAGKASIVIIPGILQLSYVENTGAAYGILQGKTMLLAVISLITVVVIVALLLVKKIQTPMLVWSICLIVAGGTGNLVDRFFRGYVIDYIDITPLFNFPVFNLADSCVVIGVFVFAAYVVFFEGKGKEKTEMESTGETIG